MKRLIAVLLVIAGSAGAQDSSFSQLRVRGALLRNPVAGHLSDDWKPGTGAQLAIGMNLGMGEVALTAGHVGFTPTTGKPAFSGTLVSLDWLLPILRTRRLEVSGGPRFTDLRMDFDDPSLVVGLRTEEEVLLGAAGRARMRFHRRFSAFAEGSYGVLMLSTRTPMAFLSVGVEARASTPNWLRDILR